MITKFIMKVIIILTGLVSSRIPEFFVSRPLNEKCPGSRDPGHAWEAVGFEAVTRLYA